MFETNDRYEAFGIDHLYGKLRWDLHVNFLRMFESRQNQEFPGFQARKEEIRRSAVSVLPDGSNFKITKIIFARERSGAAGDRARIIFISSYYPLNSISGETWDVSSFRGLTMNIYETVVSADE